ncbi:MAG: methyltransferase domain-containing protein [Pseudomonadota bacterium]
MDNTEHSLIELLACPKCDGNLDTDNKSDALKCEQCATKFPRIGDIPVLFPEPAIAIGDWQSRFDNALAKLRHEIQSLDQAIAKGTSKSLSQKRLLAQKNAYSFQIKALKKLLAPMAKLPGQADRATHQALRTRLPPDQGLDTYFPNIFRDWNWGENENRLSVEQIVESYEQLSEEKPGTILVLGAGAGRLAHDLAQHWQAGQLYALDFNPLLMSLAAKLSSGASEELFEFPIAPKRLEDFALKRPLSAPQPASRPIHWILGNALQAPFKAGSFDLVVTPWLVDIIDDEFSAFCRRVNRLLATDGHWLSFGSLAFRSQNPAHCYSAEEVAEIITAQGFDEPRRTDVEMPYLASPASRHSRVETVSTFAMRKLQSLEPDARYSALPDWIVNETTPVPADDALTRQAAATRIHAFIMAMIDGTRSLDDMAALMEQQQLMPKNEALPAIRSLLIKMFDEANRYSGF